MKEVFVYQILDEISEGVISTFIGPNDIFARRQFDKFLNDDKLKNSIDPSDFFLVRCGSVDICGSFSDYELHEADIYIVAIGADEVEVKNEA